MAQPSDQLWSSRTARVCDKSCLYQLQQRVQYSLTPSMTPHPAF
jgi:hypothetical protein